jgi:hypothetical protein
MAAGLPVIVTDCPWGPGEIVRHRVDGWLVPPEDVAALAEGLDLLMGDDALRGGLAEAALRSVRRFSRARVMALWDELVDELCPGHAAPAAEATPTRRDGLVAGRASATAGMPTSPPYSNRDRRR